VTVGKIPDLDAEILNQLLEGLYAVDTDNRIIYWNKSAERLTGYTEADVMGKSCGDYILMHIDNNGFSMCRDHCPMREAIATGELREAQGYLQHKEGHRVPVLVRAFPIRDETGRATGATQVFYDHSATVTALQRIEELENMAYIDPLTGLANRRYLRISLQANFNEIQRFNWRFGICYIDVDCFKKINDRYGHDVGDSVLKMTSRTLLNSSRSFDLAGRWGGDEFVTIVRNVDKEELAATAKRMRTLVEKSHATHEKHVIKVTVSIGATLARPDDTIETLLKRADALMYDSKIAGRNRISTDP